MAKLLTALFICFTLTLMVNFEFGKDWSTVTTISKLSDYKKRQISLDSSANSELAEILDHETSGSTCRMTCGNNVIWAKPLVFSEDETWPKIWKPGRKSKLKGSKDSGIQIKAQHKGATLKPKTQHKGAMSRRVKTQHKSAMSSLVMTQHKDAMLGCQMAQHKDATPKPCKVENNNYTLNFKAQPPWATPNSKDAQHKSAMLWSKAQHTGATPVGGNTYTKVK